MIGDILSTVTSPTTKKIASCLLGCLLGLSCTVPALADGVQLKENVANGTISTGASKLQYEVVRAEQYLAATIPMEIPFIIDSEGVVTTPDYTSCYIQNNSNAVMYVTNMEFTPYQESGIDIMTPAKVTEITNSGTEEKGISIRVTGNAGYSPWRKVYDFVIPDGSSSETVSANIPSSTSFVVAKDFAETGLDFSVTATPEVYEAFHDTTPFGKLSFTLSY